MATVHPLRGWRPRAELAARVAAVPYDVVDRNEAAALAQGNALSFLRVTRPEIDLPPSSSFAEACAKGRETLLGMVRDGVLVHDPAPSYYAYALTMGKHRQVGVVLAASVADYEAGIVRKHEHTRPDKETDRVQHMEALQAQTGKVFLLHPPHSTVRGVLAAAQSAPPEFDFVAPDAVSHQLWRIDTAEAVRTLTAAFAGMPRLYIADGHHRAAAAARVAVSKRAAGHSDPSAERMLAVAFATDSVQVLPYHRLVRDLGSYTPARLLAALEQDFAVRPGKQTLPPHAFSLFVDGAWHTLVARQPPKGDVTQRLDVSLLQERVLRPLLGIEDPRRDARIDFVGGVRGDAELERRVKKGFAAAFRMAPTPIDALLEVADAGAVMPPKSTWFEPKLRDGLVVLRFEAAG